MCAQIKTISVDDYDRIEKRFERDENCCPEIFHE